VVAAFVNGDAAKSGKFVAELQNTKWFAKRSDAARA